MKRFDRWLECLILIIIIASTSCGTIPAVTSPIASSVPSPSPSPIERPTPSIAEITTQRERFTGQSVIVIGILESEGAMADVHFFLRDARGARLQVTPWAPIEVAVGPGGSARPKSMIYFVGRRLRLTGILENPASGIILNVSLAEEL